VGVLAAAYERQTLPPTELTVPLRALASATGETAYLGVWRDGQIEIRAQATGHHAVQVANLKPGFHSDAHARASGKVLLAFAEPGVRDRYFAAHPLRRLTANTITEPTRLMDELDRVRSTGFATEEEEFSEGVACIAVPIITDPYLIGAYAISGPVERYRSQWATYLAQLRNTVERAQLAMYGGMKNGSVMSPHR
jgi:DNA-binding IclR family transcriptional regulator